jgi:hypothetical protein
MRLPHLLSIALALALADAAYAKGPPHALPDWPCDTPFAGPLEPEMLWPGAKPAPAGAWHEDATARYLVDFLTAGENSPAMGEREIADFTEKHGAIAGDTAQLVVSGMVERGNILRRVLLKGIKDQIIRSHVLAEAIAAQGVQQAVANKEEAAQAAEARRLNLNALDDTNETAERLCHRLVYDESKLRRLAEALRAHSR